MDAILGLAHGFSVALQPENLLWCVVGCFLGTVIGILPGLGPAATIAMLLPLTFNMDPTGGIIMLAGIYYGAKYGGSTTSILLNMPGEASSVVSCIDGYQMARNGRAGAALGIAAIASFVAGTIGIVILSLLAPPLAEFALRFSSPEFFALMVVGLALVVLLAGDSMLKALLSLLVGLWLTSIGTDLFTAQSRFTFGLVRLRRRHRVHGHSGRHLCHCRSDDERRRSRKGATPAGATRFAELPSEPGRAEGLPLRLHQWFACRLLHRHASRRGVFRLGLRFLRPGKGRLEASGNVRQGCTGRSRGPGGREQRRFERRNAATADLRHSCRRQHRNPSLGVDTVGLSTRAHCSSWNRRTCSGVLSPACTSATSCC